MTRQGARQDPAEKMKGVKTYRIRRWGYYKPGVFDTWSVVQTYEKEVRAMVDELSGKYPTCDWDFVEVHPTK